MFFAAMFGAISALLMVSANLWEGWIVNSYKIFSVMIILMIAFGYSGIKQLAIQVLAFYGVSFAFAGALTALIFFDGSLGEIHNGVVYWNINSSFMNVVLAAVVVAISGYTLYSFIKDKVYDGERIVSIQMVLSGCEYLAEALVDTGNELKEPFSGRSAIIVEESCVPINIDDEEFRTKRRFIPYKALGNENGALTGVIPDSVQIISRNSRGKTSLKKIEGSIVCLCKQKLSEEGKYNAIINDELLS